MELEVLFGHLLPELQWDSSDHATLCWSASTAGPSPVCSPVPRCCPVPRQGSRAALCPAAPTLGGCSLGKGLWHPNLP